MYFELKQEIYNDLKGICGEVFKNRERMTVNEMLTRLMDMEGLPIHCPYHHFIMPAALLTQTAVLENTDEGIFEKWLETAEERAKTVPAGFCGECGTCGSAVGVGIFLSVYTGATPKTMESWQHVNEATGISLLKIAKYPGPRCCKRTSFLAADAGVDYINEHYGIGLTKDDKPKCTYHSRNAECLEKVCPFYHDESSDKTDERVAIVVGDALFPRKDPVKTCKCMNEPVDMTTSKGVLMWRKSIGDRMKEGEVICEGEINKKVVEILSPCSGVLSERCVGEGEVFRAGDVLGYIAIE